MDISKTNKALIEQIKRKIAKKSNSKTFDKHIDLIKGSITKLKTFNEHLNLLSPEIKTLPELKKAVVLQNKQVKQAKQQAKEQILVNQGLRNIDKPNQNAIQKSLSILKPWKDLQAKHLNFVYKGKEKVMQIRVKHDGMIRYEIQKKVDEISKSLKRHGIKGIMEVALKYDYHFKVGIQCPIGGDIHLPQETYDELDEQDDFNTFYIYILQDNNIPEGGVDDYYNDCLYNCLVFQVGDKLPWDSPIAFKKFLKLPRDAKVGVDKLPLIASKLYNTGFSITGDLIYTCNLEATKIIHLKLCNEHYTNDVQKENKKVKNISYKKRKPIIYDTKTYMCYDGKTEYKLSLEDKKKIYQWETDNILINRDTNKMSKESYKMFRFKGNNLDDDYEAFIETKDIDKRLTLQEEYTLFIHDADILIRATDGIINLYKSGNNKETALDLFDRYTKTIANPPKINQIEASFISNCRGAIIFGHQYEGKGYKYDVKSMYPSVQNSTQNYPIGAGELKVLTTEEFNKMTTYYEYGIYRAKVSKSDKDTNKLFRFNDENYYTHIDLDVARHLKLKIELIVDGQINFIHYERSKRLAGTEIFGQFVKVMYELKQSKIPRSKAILNILQGALGERKTRKKIVSDKSELYKLPNDNNITSIKPSLYNEDETIVEYANNNNIYKLGWARVCPFIISRAKAKISKYIEPYKSICVRSHTDSMLLTEEPVGLKTGNNIGEIAYEGYSDNCKVLNSMRVIGKFTL